MKEKREILIRCGEIVVRGELNNSPTATKVWESLPIKSKAHRWGDEVYFNTGIETKLEPDATDVVEPGTICFWVEGNSVAIPFGKTPVSVGNECRLITDVNIIGKLVDDPKTLGSVNEGDEIELKRVDVMCG